MKILIVEDNPLIAQAIENAGTSLRMTADRATDGWEAIKKLEKEDYAAIVIDTDLPRHSGFGVLTYLREEMGDAIENVIVMTSSDCDDLRKKLQERVNVVTKTEEVAKLAEAVRLLCGSFATATE